MTVSFCGEHVSQVIQLCLHKSIRKPDPLFVDSLDKYARIMNGVEIIPAEQFFKALWNSEII